MSSPSEPRSARAGGALLLAGTALGVLDLVRDGSAPHGALRWAFLALAALVAVALLVRQDAGPKALALAATLGSLLVTADLLASGGASADDQMLYVLVVVFAAWHLGLGQTAFQLLLAGGGYGLALAVHHEPNALTRWATSFFALAVAAFFVASAKRTVQRIVDHYADQARRDELTGLLGRHALEEHLAHESSELAATGKPLSLVLADLAGVGLVNERGGFSAGDEVLRRAAEAIGRETRAADPFARWAGTEFALLLPDCPADRARDVAERMRSAVERAFASSPHEVRLCAGVATAEAPEDTDGLLAVAEAARLRARESAEGAVLAAGQAFPLRPKVVADRDPAGYPSAVSR